MLYGIHLASAVFELTMLVMIDTDCKGSCESNYHTITTTTAPDTKRGNQHYDKKQNRKKGQTTIYKSEWSCIYVLGYPFCFCH
jgi:hypothetical protein